MKETLSPSFQDSASRGLLQSSSSLSQERGTVRKPPRVGGEVLLSVRIDVSDWLVGWAGGRVGERTVEENEWCFSCLDKQQSNLLVTTFTCLSLFK